MKKTFTFLYLLLCWGVMFGQNDQLRHVIVVMEGQYDAVSAARKTQLMDKEQRRQFVISDRKTFCENAQRDVTRFLGGFQGQVEDIHPFWTFNGFACLATDEVIRQLEARHDVSFIYHDEYRNMLPENEKPHPVTSKDNAWHVDKVNAPSVWSYNGDTGYTGEGVVVAIIDTGVDYNHIDIAGSMWDGGAEFPHHGYDVYNQDDDPMDDHCHGTHVAGIVAGQGNGGIQTGIAPGAEIMAVKVIGAGGEASDEQVLGGIEFALEHGADVINISAGAAGEGPCDFYRDVFQTTLEVGVVAAIAAGNDGDTQYTYPVPYNIEAPGNCPPPWLHPDQVLVGGRTAVVCVGATDVNDEHCSFSSIGPATWTEGEFLGDYYDYPYVNGDASQPGLIRPDLSAPGGNITSLNYLTGNDYIAYDGTSMATPCAAGVMALLLEADPELTPAAVDSLMELTAVRIGNNKKDNRVGAGRIDALAAINALFFHAPANLSAQFDGDLVNLSWEAPAQVVSYDLYRDGLRIGAGLTENTYSDPLNYGGQYTYYVTATLDNGITTLPSNYVTVSKPVDIEAEVINNMRVELNWNMPNSIVDGFESGDFYQNMWLNDATSPWVITTDEPHSGTYCAKSTNVGMFSNSSLGLAVNVPVTCVVSYEAKISCFPLNGGGFFIDNIQQGETVKDEMPWTRFSCTLAPGNHLLEWKYANQLNEGGYANAFFIDDITVGNPFHVYREHCESGDVHLIAEDVAEAHYLDYGWDELPLGEYRYGVSNDGGATIAWSARLNKTVMDVEENEDLGHIRRVTILSTLGQVLYDAYTSEDDSASIIENFPTGIYIVNVLTDKGVVTRKELKIEN